MNTDPNKDSNWKQIVVRFLLLLVILAHALISLLVLYWVWHGTWGLGQFILDIINDEETKNLIRTITMFSTIGLISFLFQRCVEHILKSISQITKKIVTVFQSIWTPGIDNGESSLKTWRDTFLESLKLVSAVSILCIIFVCGYIALKEPDRSVIVLNDFSSSYQPENDTPQPEKPENDTPQPENDTQISLYYLSQGDLNSKKGICPEESRLVEWLALFKQALSECSENKQVKLRIRAFASTAPVTEKGRPKPEKVKSDTFNYQIANERAEAIIYFLMSEDPESYTPGKCKDALNDGWIWKGHAKSNSTWVGEGFTVTYKRWLSHTEMKDAKLVRDGSWMARRPKLEFLNRTVEIIIEDGGCLTMAVDNAEKAEHQLDGH